MTALELYRQGKSLKSISRELGIHRSTVGRMLRSSGYSPTRKGGTRLTDEQVLKSAAMSKSGYSWRAISREVGMSDKAIKRAVENYAAQSNEQSVLP